MAFDEWRRCGAAAGPLAQQAVTLCRFADEPVRKSSGPPSHAAERQHNRHVQALLVFGPVDLVLWLVASDHPHWNVRHSLRRRCKE
jgi:hypothetical protein